MGKMLEELFGASVVVNQYDGGLFRNNFEVLCNFSIIAEQVR